MRLDPKTLAGIKGKEKLFFLHDRRSEDVILELLAARLSLQGDRWPESETKIETDSLGKEWGKQLYPWAFYSVGAGFVMVL